MSNTDVAVFEWKHSTTFYQRVEDLNLHGLHFQHVTLCERRAWMYLHKINFAGWYARVQTGAAKHDTSYIRDHSVRGLLGLSPDRIDWKHRAFITYRFIIREPFKFSFIGAMWQAWCSVVCF